MLTNETISEMVRNFEANNKDLAKLIQIFDAWSIERPDKEQKLEVREQSYGSNTLEERVDHLEKCTEKPMSENKTRLQALLEVLPNIELDDDGYPWNCIDIYDTDQEMQNTYDCSNGCKECKKRFWAAKEK